MDRVRTACITGLGSGFAPFASGTWGSAVAALLYTAVWWTAAVVGASRPIIEIVTVAAILVACAMSVRWGTWAIQRFGRNDPKQFTLDEFAGQWVSLLLLPVAFTARPWTFTVAVGGQFVLFRFFDVLKPPPARQAERLPAGWGILTDDLFAGLYANLVGQAVWHWTSLPTWFGA